MSKALQERPSSLTVRQAVEAFALEMDGHLKDKDWSEYSDLALSSHLSNRASALSTELMIGPRVPERIRELAADIGNIAMIIADNFGELRPFNNKTY